MAYELIIAEKPQAAKKIAEALADKTAKKEAKKKVPYYTLKHNGKEIVVACAVGHIYGLAQKVEGKKKWTYPVFNIEWVPSYSISKTSAFTKNYLDVIQTLAKKAKDVTIATDYDAEGEVIGLNVMRFACNKKDANRMKFSTLTKKELIHSYEDKANKINWPQANAGETRHILDWYWGINLSRALTLAVKLARGGFKLLSAGRVQGPALKLVVEKEKEIRAFKPDPYWELKLTGKFGKNKVEGLHQEGKIWEKKKAADIYKKVKDEKSGKISKIDKRQQKQKPPVPFDLTTLQTEAHKCLRISPKETLALAQNLYINGFISYPRTSSQKLPERLGLRNILKEIAKNKTYKALADKLLKLKTLKPNEGKKTDDAHPSIYPTGNIPGALTDREGKLYDLIVRRFLSVFGEPAVRETVKAYVDVKKELFVIEGTRTVEKNWHEFYGSYVMLDEVELPAFKEKDEINITKIDKLDKETSPPKRYTESSIIRALEKANLGTKATRSTIIETLFTRGYVLGKSIEATELGIKTVEILHKYAPRIIDQELTRTFEDYMEEIRKGKKTEEEVLETAKARLIEVLEDFKKNEKKIGEGLGEAENEGFKQRNTVGKCPNCKNGNLMIRKSKFGKFIGCDAYPDCKTTFSLPSNGIIKPTEEVCAECNHPKVNVRYPRQKEQLICINPKCVTWTKEWKEKQAK